MSCCIAFLSGILALVQNVGEAEYLVTWYQYMRLAGYPAEKISILTTYNGQKALLKDVFENRCAGHPAFGRPHKVPVSYCAARLRSLQCRLCQHLRFPTVHC